MRRFGLFFLTNMIALSLVFTGCKKDEEENFLEYKSQGSIKGTVTGKTAT